MPYIEMLEVKEHPHTTCNFVWEADGKSLSEYLGEDGRKEIKLKIQPYE